ncbi:gliding motility-associated ABC transporter substrate-binding protein GldG [Croceivirga thetidis]|uniref:Gliding motility-associated ABC transporter substrate-binding protein GldG n=1 Tax=Croceivirga thetidis TaxID=2721623 RepID=A0ABX1GR21_9FLAO|nr:gliding motility-associated ABC transporter substrate-binding protein GldG [Croceivirga thetidis]NKI32029.1 gliding motility-associated ABC transporter substrate-binding protein GldG [Croceivirga thetidis]
MYAIFKKEIQSFFSSLIGYLILSLFLVLSGLFLWVFKGPFNILDYGFADLSLFFLLAPWVFLFLIPALTMKSFAEEKSLGTIELLLIKPLTTNQLTLGKFLAYFVLCVIAVLPTIIYVFAISDLGIVKGNYDFGQVLGSYFGILFLIATYVSIGLFSSSLTQNQIVSFLLAVTISFFFFYGFESVASLFEDGKQQRWIQSLGAKYHFDNIAKGVISIQNVCYFLSLTILFHWLTSRNISTSPSNKISFIKVVSVLILLICLGRFANYRFDLTKDKRYTLSQEAKLTVEDFDSPVIVDILLEGNLPSEFARLQAETTQLLDAFKAENKNLSYNLVNPLEDTSNQQQTISDLQQIGLAPADVTIQEDGKVSREFVFPWAMVNSGNKTVKVPLLKNTLGANTEERVNNSVQQLEYAFADAFTKLNILEKKRIAVLKGNGELDDIYITDFLTSIREYYNIAAFTLDSVASSPQKTLKELQTFDLALIAKPTEAFTDEEKYVLDQFVVEGGKSIWLLDKVAMELDSLFNEKGSSIATLKDLNLTDFFFKYGVRLNPVLVNDLYNTPIVLATGSNSDSNYNPLPWVYNPMVFSKNDHPINTNIEAVRMQFANTIDTLSNQNSKTILLRSSPLSQEEGIPSEIKLSSITEQKPKESYVGKGNLPLAVLLEGEFKSAYSNRIAPIKIAENLDVGPDNKMIIISDGDIIKNQLRNGQPLELGYDKWTNNFYGNKEFLINCVNYLLDDTGLLKIRAKEVDIPLLDPQKIMANKVKWQVITILVPFLLILLFGSIFHIYRKRQFTV